jgi:hypothetical protein
MLWLVLNGFITVSPAAVASSWLFSACKSWDREQERDRRWWVHTRLTTWCCNICNGRVWSLECDAGNSATQIGGGGGGALKIFVVGKFVVLGSAGDCAYFLGAFAKSRKANISFVMSVRPHGTTRLPLHGFWWGLIFELIFRKSVEKIQVSLRYDKNDGYCTWRCFHIYDNISLNKWEIFQINFLDKIKTQFVFSGFFFFFWRSCRGGARQATDDII